MFIDFADDNVDPNNTLWPRPTGLGNGSGPSYISSIIDGSAATGSTNDYNLTNYFRKMSNNQYIVLGQAVYVETPYTLAEYEGTISEAAATRAGHIGDKDLNFSGNIQEAAAQHAIRYLDVDQNWDFGQFDNWSINTTGTPRFTKAPNGNIELVMFCFRRFYYDEIKDADKRHGFRTNGSQWPHELSNTTFTTVDVNASNNTYRSIKNVCFCLNMIDIDRNFGSALVHEYAHNLLGGNEYHQYAHGMWTMLGDASGNKSYMANAYERVRLGWTTFTDITSDNTTASIPDFASTLAAYRIVNTEDGSMYIFENHQATAQYDLVDKTNNGAPGLYIIRYSADPPTNEQTKKATYMLECADGKWGWSWDGCDPAPWDQNQGLAVALRGSINRYTGATDRGYTAHSPACAYPQGDDWHIWCVRDPKTGTALHGPGTNGTPRHWGDGNDRWTTDNKMFSPWSNPSSRATANENINVGVEVTGLSGSNINVRFYTEHPEYGPPTKPQDFKAAYIEQSATECYSGYRVFAHCTWEGNIEPDLAGYKIYREAIGIDEDYILLTTVDGSTTEYWDDLGCKVSPQNQTYTQRYRYKIVAIDDDNKISGWSDDDYVDVGESGDIPWKQTGRTTPEKEFALYGIHPNPSQGVATIEYTIPVAGEVVVRAVNTMGTEVYRSVEYQRAGKYVVQCSGEGMRTGIYTLLIQWNGGTRTGRMIIINK